MTLNFGGEKLVLVYAGPAHTKGDIFIWMPNKKVMFSGDIVFADRLLGPGPAKDTASWLKVFKTMTAYHPEIIVPGHGKPASIESVTKDTYDYIAYMRAEVTKIINDDGDMLDALKIDQSKFRYLKVFDKMARRSAQAFFEQMEFEETKTDDRVLLEIPFKDRENLTHVMQKNLENLENLGKMINAVANDDLKSVQEIAEKMSFNKKKGKGLARRGNPAFTAIGVQFHAVDTLNVMEAAKING